MLLEALIRFCDKKIAADCWWKAVKRGVSEWAFKPVTNVKEEGIKPDLGDNPKGEARRSTQTITGMIAAGEAYVEPEERKSTMKKLMFALATAAALVGMADIESTNVVGFSSGSNGAAEFKLVTPQFKLVGGSGVKLQDIAIKNGGTPWSDFLQVVDADSVGQAMYTFATADESGFAADGWLSEDMSSLADVVLEPGQSVLLYTEGDVEIVDAGEVATADTVVPSVAGFNIVGNNTPEAINIQDVVLGEGATSWADFIQFLGTDAVAELDMYTYATADESGFAADGWLTPDMSELANVEIPAGVGFLLYTESAGVNITVPSAL